MALPLRLNEYHPYDYLITVRDGSLKDRITKAMDIPYPADPLFEPELLGLTMGEVAILKQVQMASHGSINSLELILDRTVGKVANNNVNLNATMTYQDFLDKIAREDGVVDIDGSGVSQRESDEIT